MLDLISRHSLMLHSCRYVVLDEADEMLDMGFAEDVETILARCPRERQTALFSATMPPEVEALARKYLRKPMLVQVGRRSSAATTVTHAVYPVPRERKTRGTSRETSWATAF